MSNVLRRHQRTMEMLKLIRVSAEQVMVNLDHKGVPDIKTLRWQWETRGVGGSSNPFRRDDEEH